MIESDLVSAFVPLEAAAALRILQEQWCIAGTDAARLATERDDSFICGAADGSRYVLKIANPADDPVLIDLQTQALLHAAARDAYLPVQRLIPDRSGSFATTVDSPDGARLARLFSYVEGQLLDHATTTTDQRHAFGRAVGRLTSALTDFDHPAADRRLDWDVARLPELKAIRHHVDPLYHREADQVLSEFDGRSDALAAIRKQVIHGDTNPGNVIVDDSADFVAGILDFGDVVRTHTPIDAANAMAYAIGPGRDPWSDAAEVLTGYLDAFALAPEEIRLLPLLVRGRLAQRILVNSWMASVQPDNADYTGRNIAPASAALRAVLAAPDPEWSR